MYYRLSYIVLLILLLLLPSSALYAGLDQGGLDKEVEKRLLDGSAWEGRDVEVVDIELPAGIETAKYDAIKIVLPKGARSLGKVSFTVELTSSGRITKTLWGSARIVAYTKAYVALAPLKKGHVLNATDITLKRTEVAGAYEVTGPDDVVVGMVLKRPIHAGALVKRDYLRSPDAVKRGEDVALLLDNGKLRIKIAGVASEDAPIGASIRARSNSGKEVRGTVTGIKEITVSF